MKLSELEQLCGTLQKNTRFYWYTGEAIKGRIARVFNNNLWSYFFAGEEHASLINSGNPDLEFLEKHCRFIVTVQGQKVVSGDYDVIELERINHSENWSYSSPEFLRNSVFDKLIVVGAGASFDFDHKALPDGIRPFPLANDLFKEDLISMLNTYPGVRSMKSKLSRTDNLEQTLQSEWERLNSDFDKNRIADLINLQFYLHELFLSNSIRYVENDDNNYSALASSIYDYTRSKSGNGQRKKVAIISYNYDTLLDRALEQRFGFKYSTLDDYIDGLVRPFVLFKPHGSCNWGKKLIHEKEFRNYNLVPSKSWPVWNPLLEGDNKHGIDYRNTLTQPINVFAEHLHLNRVTFGNILNAIHPEITVIPLDFKLRTSSVLVSHERLYFPQLLIPLKHKDEFVMPQDHTKLLIDILPSVKEILSIGWKGSEQKMCELFKKHCSQKINLHMVDYNSKIRRRVVSDELTINRIETFKNLAQYLSLGKKLAHLDGFTGYADKLINSKESFFSEMS